MKVKCNKYDQQFRKCCRCPHGKDHEPIGNCPDTEIKCTRDLSVNITVITRCEEV